MEDLVAAVLAWAWWTHDQKPEATQPVQITRQDAVRRAWDVVVGEFEPSDAQTVQQKGPE